MLYFHLPFFLIDKKKQMNCVTLETFMIIEIITSLTIEPYVETD